MEPNASAETVKTDETAPEDNVQRKRSREGSRVAEDETSRLSTNVTVEEKTESETMENADQNCQAEETAGESGAQIKRPRLQAEQNGITHGTTRTRATATTTVDLKDVTPTTTDDDDDGDDNDNDDDEEEEDDDDDDDDDDEDEYYDDDDDDEEDENNFKHIDANLPAPKPSVYSFLRNREFGIFHPRRTRADCHIFHNEMISNRAVVQKMSISHTLDGHDGCVNALSFNRTGTLLASGSDDLRVMIWDWALEQVAVSYESEHYGNVFQTKFVPFSNDCRIVSCARDGQVRLGELRPDGSFLSTKKLVEHTASAHKITIDTMIGTDVFSCGEDGSVYHIDLREQRANKILTIRTDQNAMLPLYSIELNRNNQNEFVLAGMDPHIRIYDRRNIEALTSKPAKSFCPDLIKKIENMRHQPSVTCAIYNHDGTEILATYNDEDIYLFDARHSDGADAIHQYRGHRNNHTVKGVSFYGRNSEYVISGSDCGHIFLWEKKSEKCVWFARGDDDGTVNVLEPHPHFPVLATSGLDHNIKIWQPLDQRPVDFRRMKTIMKRNARERKHDQQYVSAFDPETGDFLRLMRPVFRRIVQRAAGGNMSYDEHDDENDSNRDERQFYSLDCAPS